MLAAAAAWADLHSAESIGDAAVLAEYGENAVAVTDPGAPLVAKLSDTYGP